MTDACFVMRLQRTRKLTSTCTSVHYGRIVADEVFTDEHRALHLINIAPSDISQGAELLKDSALHTVTLNAVPMFVSHIRLPRCAEIIGMLTLRTKLQCLRLSNINMRECGDEVVTAIMQSELRLLTLMNCDMHPLVRWRMAREIPLHRTLCTLAVDVPSFFQANTNLPPMLHLQRNMCAVGGSVSFAMKALVDFNHPTMRRAVIFPGTRVTYPRAENVTMCSLPVSAVARRLSHMIDFPNVLKLVFRGCELPRLFMTTLVAAILGANSKMRSLSIVSCNLEETQPAHNKRNKSSPE